MMPDLARIYDRDFFEKWGSRNAEYVMTAEFITGMLNREFRPQRLIDIGCGCGVYAHFFRELGVDVVAVDGVTPHPEFAFPGDIEIRDLTDPLENVWGGFDMSLCLEVAEHIPEDLRDVFLRNVCQFSDTLVISCAPPFQGGDYHVNEQPKRYWREHLVRFGFAYNRRRTGVLSETFKVERPPLMWMCQQISVYDRMK